MKKLFIKMAELLRQGEDLVLATIIASSGATPRGVGARMLIGKQGRILGTIGGGAVEYRSEQLGKKVLETRCSSQFNFSLTRDDVENLGMICGGAVNVFFSYIPASDPDTLALIDEALLRFQQQEGLWLISDITGGGKLSLYSKSGGYFGIQPAPALAEHLTRQPHRFSLDGCEFYIEQINAPGLVYIFGGGHVAQELEPVLTHVGFRCVVMDDRPEFARQSLFPSAQQVLLVDFNRIGDFVSIGENDYVCIMTRGHAFDTVIQAQVLRAKPYYVGVIGSRQKAAGVRQRLKEEYALSDDLLDRVTTPIGLSIGAQTPEEIAISIAGQLIAAHAGKLPN